MWNAEPPGHEGTDKDSGRVANDDGRATASQLLLHPPRPVDRAAHPTRQRSWVEVDPPQDRDRAGHDLHAL